MKVLQTSILPEYYHAPSVFNMEVKHVFDKTWQFVGFYQDISEADSYITVDLFGESIVVKNFDGELRAFKNVCSHRFSRICNRDKGSGHLQCPYHGWTYDKEGLPYAIPEQQGFADLDRSRLRLKAYKVERCGNFVFVAKDMSVECLSNFLGPYANYLQEVSVAMGEQIDCNQKTIAANWKVVVENTLEHYHIRLVHPESFYTLGVENAVFSQCGSHSSAQMEVQMKLDDASKVGKLLADRPWKVKDYVHHLVFPCLTVASAYGTTVAVQTIVPKDASTTVFTSYVFATKLENSDSKTKAVQSAINEAAVEFNRKVFDEDKDVCEYVQKGISETERQTSPLHAKEERIVYFHRAYESYVGDELSKSNKIKECENA